jgi:hypothetical protein
MGGPVMKSLDGPRQKAGQNCTQGTFVPCAALSRILSKNGPNQ